MQKCATNRSLAKYFWLGLITLGIYDIVVMVRLGKDLNRVKEKLDIKGRKLMHYFGCMMLSIITLGIPLFIWEIKAPIRTYLYAEKTGVEKKGSVALFFVFNTVLVWTLVCPLIAMSKLLKTANNVCIWYNNQLEPEVMEAKEEPKAIESKEEPKAEEKPAPVAKEEKPAPKAEEKAPAKKEEKAKEEKKPAAPKEEEKAEPVKKAAPAKKAEEKKEPATAKKVSDTAAYHLSKRAEDGKWQVFITGSDKVIKLFDTKAEAEAWTKEKAESTGRSVLIHASKGKNKGRIQ